MLFRSSTHTTILSQSICTRTHKLTESARRGRAEDRLGGFQGEVSGPGGEKASLGHRQSDWPDSPQPRATESGERQIHSSPISCHVTPSSRCHSWAGRQADALWNIPWFSPRTQKSRNRVNRLPFSFYTRVILCLTPSPHTHTHTHTIRPLYHPYPEESR